MNGNSRATRSEADALHSVVTSPRRAATAMPRGQSGVSAVDADVRLLDQLNVIFKYRYVALSVMALVVLGSLLRTYTTTPLYRAQARLLIELEDERTAVVAGTMNTNTGSNEYLQDPEPYYNTQYRILTGRELGRRVVQRLQLETVPEFNGRGPTPTAVSRTLAQLRDQVETPVRALLGRPRPAHPASTVARDPAALV